MDLSFMKEEEFKPIVKRFLQSLGFDVFEIENKQGILTPDFEAIGKNDKYTIELKIKCDDQEEVSTESEVLSRGESITKSIPLSPRNTLGGIIRDGVKQLIEHDHKGDSFRILWLHCGGQDPSLHNERFQSTLFGSQMLISLRRSGIITCYYFHESAFYTWRNYLDGAILTHENKALLCINSLSPRVEQFRQSELVIGMSNGLCDPKLEESSDGVMIADCSIDRKRPGKILGYLQDKYGLDHLRALPMKRHTIAVSLPASDDS